MNTPFLRIAPEGISILFVLALCGWIFSFLGLGVFSFLCLLAFGFSLYFFRDPERESDSPDDCLTAPSDGKVLEVVTETESSFLNREVTRVSVFLSLFDCHVNWFPVSGEVTARERVDGKFGFGFSSAASRENERLATVIKPSGGGPELVVVQVAGFVARRIISHASRGDVLKRGQRFGIIKFGSRIDLFLPPEYKVEVRKGDILTGAESVVARLARGGDGE